LPRVDELMSPKSDSRQLSDDQFVRQSSRSAQQYLLDRISLSSRWNDLD